MQRMIRQFAAEYTSKTTQDDPPVPNGTMKDQSLPRAASLAPAPALASNPVLSKLLMTDQDGPLDLTVKKNHVDPEPSQQDGVLDLSTKKNHSAGSPLLKTSPSFSTTPGTKGRSLRVDRTFREVDEEDGLLPRSLQDGLRENFVSSTSLKPPLARSLLIKEELLSQKHRLLRQPAALSLANLESAALLNHGQSHSLLGQKGSSSPWGGKAHLDNLLKLKQAGGALSGVSKAHHHHEGKREQGHSPPVDLKIPQVRGMDLSWDSHASELYGYSAMGVGSGGHGENALSRKLRAILPKQNRRGGLGGSLGGLLDGAADYWGSDVDHSTSGPAYSTSDVEGDPSSKQPRKKRGRYRQYNSEILEEAIAVVMSGKMSVSKAQNIYGIPHSTLEYKVKERMGTLKNPPKKKLKLMMRMEAGGQDSAAESENTPTATPRDDGPPLAAAELKDD
uniref:Ligand dependent nuclear receptor corepressor n=1 Tax=Myripristis murdjan TaxID=586833 RepID=A0A667WII3_9TELE